MRRGLAIRPRMSRLVPVVVASLLCRAGSLPLGAVEAGDVDADGRLSLADVFHLKDELPPAEGSLDPFRGLPCFSEELDWFLLAQVEGIIFLESLRRSVPGSFSHWENVWGDEVRVEPLPTDSRVRLRLQSATAAGGARDRVRIRTVLTTTVPIRAFSLVLESDENILRVPFTRLETHGHGWRDASWRYLPDVAGRGNAHTAGDLTVLTGTPTHLITAGRTVMTYNLAGQEDVIAPGEHTIITESRLPRGAAPGTYGLRFLPASEVLLEDGAVLSPAIASAAELTIDGEVTGGWNEGIPPLEFDPAGRLVRGKVAFRLADRDGVAPAPGEPVATGRPGEEVPVRVQIRVETPLNSVYFKLRWPSGGLLCDFLESVTVLFNNPEDRHVYAARSDHYGCVSSFMGRHHAWFRLAGGYTNSSWEFATYRDRPLEYFKPLGEWVDVTEIRFTIPGGAGGGQEIPLFFDPYVAGTRETVPDAEFAPYITGYPCNPDQWRPTENWGYDIDYEDSSIRVVGEDPPDPPPDLGIEIEVGDVSGAPGELVEVPLRVSSGTPLTLLRLALRFDPQVIAIDETDFEFYLRLAEEFTRVVIPRQGGHLPRECIDENNDGIPDEQCTPGIPFFVAFRDSTPDSILVDILPGDDAYPGPALREIARLRVRIRGDAAATETVIRPAPVTFINNGVPEESVSGGRISPHDESVPFSPARSARAGTVAVQAASLSRGDANVDGKVNLGDPVATLNFLFLGADDPGCQDAADSNDNGTVDISDAIFTLGFLFLGNVRLPAPLECGRDETADSLSCELACGS